MKMFGCINILFIHLLCILPVLTLLDFLISRERGISLDNSEGDLALLVWFPKTSP